MSPRRFNQSQRAALFLAADGECSDCGAVLEAGWHADHMQPWSRGGETDLVNGQALCAPCNLRKGNESVTDLRPWQRRMHEKWLASRPVDALVSATPGAGKTFAALKLAQLLMQEKAVGRLIVVAPTDALREQWADEAGKVGLNLKPVSDPADYDKDGYDGCVVTYQQLAGKAAGAGLLRRSMRQPTFAILDEVHHAGDQKAWGDALREAVELAEFRLLLTGTPWRKDKKSPIPFVEYIENKVDGETVLTPEVFFAYEYGSAVGDGVCRRVEFHAYDGEARWVDLGEVQEAQLGEDLDEDHIAAVFDAVLNPRYPWIKGLLTKAALALDELRQDVPAAGGLVVADSQQQAREYANRLADITGEAPALALSEDGPKAKADIERFRNGSSRWLVSVRMVSEGVDIPRLAVGVYATRWKTPLFFRQVVGRFVRVGSGGDYNSLLFIPSVPTLLRHAREIEEELRHELELAVEQEEAERERADDGQQTLDLRQILSAGDATFHSAILSGEEVTPGELEQARQHCLRHGIPSTCAAAVAQLLREVATPIDVTLAPKQSEQPRHRVEKLRRDELEQQARKFAYKAHVDFKQVNSRLYGVFGQRAKMTVEQLDEAIVLVSKWIAEL